MEQELRATLAYNLRVERAKKDISQEYLAEKAEISPKHLTKIENEKVTPSIYIVYKLARALELTVNDLIYKSNS